MCYSGICKYEDHFGDCNLRSTNIRKGLKADYMPDDAGCVIADREIEKMEEAREKAKNFT